MRSPRASASRSAATYSRAFGIFGLSTGESATFSGPATVNNVIGRVTGGNPSSIDGKIQSSDRRGQSLSDQPERHRLRPERDGQRLGQLSRLDRRLSQDVGRGEVSSDQSRRQHLECGTAGGVRVFERAASRDHGQRQHARAGAGRPSGWSADRSRSPGHALGARRHDPRDERRRHRRGAGRPAQHRPR